MADTLKTEGNDAFSNKEFEKAIELYTKALELDPNNYSILNNRSGAYHSKGDMEAAIRDARKGLEISNNSKGHSRVAAALWSMGKLREAKDEYELAMVLAPGNQNIRENLQRLRTLLGTEPPRQSGGYPPAGATTTSVVPLALDCLVMFSTVLQVVLGLFAPSLGVLFWRLCLLGMLCRQLLILHQDGMLKPELAVLKRWLSNFSGLYAIVTMAALAFLTPAQMLLAVAMLIYCLVDAVGYSSLLQLKFPAIHAKAHTYIQRLQSARSALLANAATSEVFQCAFLFFGGSGTIFLMAYMFFISRRYSSDQFSRLAFSTIRGKIQGWTSRGPAFIDNAFSRLCDALHAHAMR